MCPPHFSKVRFRPAGVHTAAVKRSLMKLRRTMNPKQVNAWLTEQGLISIKTLWAKLAPLRRTGRSADVFRILCFLLANNSVVK